MIINILNNKVYIGSSVNVFIRCRQHVVKLENNNHENRYLQRSWNKYGKENFYFSFLETIKDKNNLKNNLIEKEQYWLDSFKSYNRFNGYNINIIANSCLGVKKSKETCKKMSQSQKGRCSPNHSKFMKEYYKTHEPWNKGKKSNMSLESREKISRATIEANLGNKYRLNIPHTMTAKAKISAQFTGELHPCSKLNNFQVKVIKRLLEFETMTQQNIADFFNVNHRTISRIKVNKGWFIN